MLNMRITDPSGLCWSINDGLTLIVSLFLGLYGFILLSSGILPDVSVLFSGLFSPYSGLVSGNSSVDSTTCRNLPNVGL